MFPKKIFLTYKRSPPKGVLERWKKLNPDYEIELSLDDSCINYLKRYFQEDKVKLFINIPQGMFKADLWRLCKLYIYGGVYADIDLVPYTSIS